MSDQKWEYSFQVFPDETMWAKNEGMRQLFECYSRVALEFTESGFTAFRSKLLGLGYTLREIERVPHHDPESIL